MGRPISFGTFGGNSGRLKDRLTGDLRGLTAAGTPNRLRASIAGVLGLG
jgi:hypothetical protein